MRRLFLVFFLHVIFAYSASAQPSFNTYYPVSDEYGLKMNFVGYVNNALFAAGDSGLLIRSSDDGASWSRIQTGFPYNLNSLIFTNNSYAYFMACSGGRVLKGYYTGTNWGEISTGAGSDLSSIVAYSNYSFLSAGSGGCIIASSNSGYGWRKIETGTTANLKQMGMYMWGYYYYFYVCGDNGKILKAKVLYSRPDSVVFTDCSLPQQVNLNSVYIKDTVTAVCAGENGKIFRTTNQGLSWTEMNSPVNTRLNKLIPVVKAYYDTFILYACGDNGVILRSEDKGVSWNVVPSGVNADFTSFFSNPLLSFSVSGKGQVYKCIKPADLGGAAYAFQSAFETKRIRTYIQNTGTFNKDLRTNNTPGFSWPKDSNRFAVFTQGLSVAARYNGDLRMANASYMGEFVLGSFNNEIPENYPYFMIYSVKKGDNYSNSLSWANWDKMVPYGAPFVDVNNNGIYDPVIDTPGVKNAYQTVFLAMTDGYSYTHNQSEGLPGGTQPLFADMRLTAWSYESDSLADVQFLKYNIINKSGVMWDSVHFCFFSDPDLGDAVDDYMGCDIPRNMTFCYNYDNMDGTGNPPSYGLNPPAVGFKFLQTPVIRNVQPPAVIGMSSFTYHNKNINYSCERDPNLKTQVFNYFKGLKSDGSSWLDASVTPPVRTKFNFSGDPETNSGWTERKGSIHNCGGDTTGVVEAPRPPGDRRFFMNTGSEKLQMYPGDAQTIVLAQMIKRGANNLNAVTVLKDYSDYVESFYNSIDQSQIIPYIPESFMLYQNYPNPFNAVTKIKYQLNFATNVKLEIFDILGRRITTPVNQFQNPGVNVVTFDGSKYASGVYFYRLETDKFSDIKKMVLVK